MSDERDAEVGGEAEHRPVEAADAEPASDVESESVEAADAEPAPGAEPDEAGDALLSRLRLIEDQDLSTRAESLGQVHDELRSRLESGDGPASRA